MSDVIGISTKTGDTKTIKEIALKPGAKLSQIEGFKLSNAFSLGFNATDFANYVPHSTQIVIFDRTSRGRKVVDALKDADDLFIIGREKALNGNYEAYGLTTGMACTGLTSAVNDANAGAYVLTFSAPNELYTPPIIEHIASGGTLPDTDVYLTGLSYPMV